MTDDRDKPVLADWSLHPGHTLMRQKLLQAREDYYVALAKILYAQPDLIADTDLRSKSAFFRGALWILNQPVFERKALERAMTEGVEDA